MAIKQVQLIAPVTLTALAASYLLAPANTTYRIGRAVFVNSTGGAIPVTAYLVPQAGAPSAGNELIPAISVPAGATYVSPELAGLVVPAGSSVQALGAGLVLYASGVSIQ